MASTILKYALNSPACEIDLPIGAKILSVQVQGQDAFMWALVNMARRRGIKSRHVAIYLDGHLVPDDPGRFINTFQIPELGMAFHAFEVGG